MSHLLIKLYVNKITINNESLNAADIVSQRSISLVMIGVHLKLYRETIMRKSIVTLVFNISCHNY